MSVDSNQVFTCPASARHFFKDMRAKSKAAGPPWRFFMRCVKCTAMLCQIVSEKKEGDGTIVPIITAYIITASGNSVVLSSTIKKAAPQETPSL